MPYRLLAAIESGSMPPWKADPDYRTYEGERVLTEDEIELFRAWVDAGTPKGEATEPIISESIMLEADLVGLPVEPYVPTYADNPDDYHCFVLDMEFEEDAFIAASQVTPGSPAVHHVIVYALSGSQIDEMEAADAAEPGPGYTCFGGPLPTDEDGAGAGGFSAGGFPNQVGEWVPGKDPTVFPDDLGIRIEAGSKIVMQVHYSAAAAEPEPDLSQFEIVLHDSPPARTTTTRPYAVLDLDIPAGDPEVTVSKTLFNTSDEPVVIRELIGHMHLLGTRQTLRVVKPGGDTECALDIPQWDFDWQQSYVLPDDAPVVVQPGEGLELTCVYDNSPENQAVVDGEPREPEDVSWGDGTWDEMCLLYVGVVEDLAPPAAETDACDNAAQCLNGCDDGDMACLVDCDAMDVDCLTCTVEVGSACGLASCALPLAAAQDCIVDCASAELLFEAPLGPCMSTLCPEAVSDFASCADPVLDEGACDAALSACGVEL